MDAAAAMDDVGDAKECKYHIITRQGTEWGSGTQAEITFTIWDKNNNTFQKVVDGYKDVEFRTDSYTTIGPFMEKCMTPCRIKITSDFTGIAPAFYFKYVKVNRHWSMRPYYYDTFFVDMWLGPTAIHKHQVTVDHCNRKRVMTTVGASSVEDRLPFFSVI